MFNTYDGTVIVCNGGKLQGGMNRNEVKSTGLVVLYQLPSHDDWTTITVRPCEVEDHRIYYTLTFHKDILNKIAFSFVDHDAEPRALQLEYQEFLRKELGRPSQTLHDGLTVLYSYTWGEISATYDPRNGSSAIHVTWKDAMRVALGSAYQDPL